MLSAPAPAIPFGWSARGEVIRTAGWSDPLGLRKDVATVADALVPVFRQRHNTVEQFGLLCFGLTSEDPSRRILHIARMWAHACARTGVSWAGQRRARHQGDGPFDLTIPLLNDEEHHGLWTSNRGVASRLGLITLVDPGLGSRPEAYTLTQAGKRVAATFRHHLVAKGGPQTLGALLRHGSCTMKDLRLLKVDSAQGRRRLAAVLSEQLASMPAEYDAAVRLQAVHRLEGRLTTTTLQRQAKLLSADQREAVRSARAVERSIAAIERPFRWWMTDPGSSVDLDASVWSRSWWSDLAWSPAASEVRSVGPDGWSNLHDLATRLAAHRDAPFPVRGEVRRSWRTVPRERFRLDTFEDLLTAGLMG